MRHIQSNFNGGEWSPQLECSVQLERYNTSTRVMKNFLPTIFRPARKRPGMEFLAFANNEVGEIRIESFRFNDDTTYLLEFSENFITIREDGIAFFGLSSSYQSSQIKDLRLQAINDVIYIAHPDHPLRQLSRVADRVWTLTDFVFEGEPFEEIENNNPFLTFSGLPPSGDFTRYVVGSTPPIFNASDVGKRIQVIHDVATVSDSDNHLNARRDGVNLSDSNVFVGTEIGFENNLFTCIGPYFFSQFNDSNDPSEYPESFEQGVVLLPSRLVSGGWEFVTQGIWSGTVRIDVSDDNETWQTLFTMTSDANENFLREGDESDNPIYIRVVASNASTDNGGGDGTMMFTELSHQITRVGTVDSLVNDSELSVRFEGGDLVDESPTDQWSFNVWNNENGFPSHIALHDSRLFLGGTRCKPQTVWASEVDFFNNFSPDVNDSDPLEFTIASGNQDPIRFMQVQKNLIIGTSQSIWAVGSFEDSVITPSSISVKRQSGKGAAQTEVIAVDDFCIYVQEGSRNIRSAINSYERGGYISQMINMTAEHITSSGIRRIAYQQSREPIIFAIRNDGKVACCLYENDQSLIGWYLLETDGEVLDVAVIPSDDEEDEVYFVVDRMVNGVRRRMIERFALNQFRAQDDVNMEDLFYVDSGVSIDADNVESVSGLNHLEGLEVQVVEDGSYAGFKTVTNGSITLNNPSSRIVVGRPYEAILMTHRPELVTSQGTIQGAETRINEIVVNYYNTIGVSFSDRLDGDFTELDFQSGTSLGDRIELQSGNQEVSLDASHTFDSAVVIRSNIAMPCTIRCIVSKFEVTGR